VADEKARWLIIFGEINETESILTDAALLPVQLYPSYLMVKLVGGRGG
jgi:hypothetical protein